MGAAKLQQLMIRHTKSQRIGGEVALALPDADVSTIMLDMSSVERKLYDLAIKFDKSKLAPLARSGSRDFSLEQALKFQRQACANIYSAKKRISHKVGFENAHLAGVYGRPTGVIAAERNHYHALVEGCTKLRALRDDLRLLRRADAAMHAVVFTHHVAAHEMIVATLEKDSFTVLQIKGSMEATRRHQAIRDFQASGESRRGGAKVFVVTVKTGSVGVTLTAATRVYLFEPAFDPATEAQMAGRIHRLGQTKDVLIKRLVFKDSVEENVCSMHDKIKAGSLTISDGTFPAAAVRTLRRRPLQPTR